MPVRQIASANTAEGGAVITPSNTVNQPVPFRAIWVGTGGNIDLFFSDGTSVVFSSVPAGMFAVGGLRVNAAGTTAANLVAVY